MTQFDKVVYIDADCLVVQNIDHLFECEGPICAGINTPIPDKFNTGLMVFKPDERVFEGMSEEWNHIGFFEDVEQGLLNHYYPLTNFKKRTDFTF
jgi:glycogenin glucosyltransferase